MCDHQTLFVSGCRQILLLCALDIWIASFQETKFDVSPLLLLFRFHLPKSIIAYYAGHCDETTQISFMLYDRKKRKKKRIDCQRVRLRENGNGCFVCPDSMHFSGFIGVIGMYSTLNTKNCLYKKKFRNSLLIHNCIDIGGHEKK